VTETVKEALRWKAFSGEGISRTLRDSLARDIANRPAVHWTQAGDSVLVAEHRVGGKVVVFECRVLRSTEVEVTP